MTTNQYLAALDKLGLLPHSNAAKAALGIEARQLAGLASGDRKPTPMLELLLKMYLRHGITKR